MLEDARQFVLRGSDLGARIEGLESAIAAARGRLDDAMLDEVTEIAGRGAGRLRLSAQHTVVAIAGATGSGKSSTFNALTGLELSSTGVRRPTTSWATACVWGSADAEGLLDWLGIPPRHQTMRDSLLDIDGDAAYRADRELDGVVLMDLPDHDSTEVAHHLEVDRLVVLADLLVWVLDPQKYADAAIHDRYFAPLSTHSGIMVVVLNHIDTVPEDRRQSMVDDVRRLLDLDGLQDVPVFAVSARHDIGIDDLRGEIAGRVAAKRLTRERIESDLRAAAHRVAEANGEPSPRELTAARVTQVENELAEAAGIPVIVDAVERVTRSRAELTSTWPPFALLARLRPDPLKQLGIDLGQGSSDSDRRGAQLRVQRSRVEQAARDLADDVSHGLAPAWQDSLHRVTSGRAAEIGDRLDRAMSKVDLSRSGLPGWAGALGLLQWVLFLGALGAGVWTTVTAADGTLTGPDLDVGGFPLPVVAIVVPVVLGLVLAVVARGLVAAAARARAEEIERSLRGSVKEIVREEVEAPVRAELDARTVISRALVPTLTRAEPGG
ncbi:MAG: GTPase [Nocardioides sp.]